MGFFGSAQPEKPVEDALPQPEKPMEHAIPKEEEVSEEGKLDEDVLDEDVLDEDVQDEIADAITEDKDMMLDIILRIKEDDEYAKSIYKNCTRLQNLLEKHPDLRPIFEDPKFVLINFEKVYRDSGGVLPWDEEEVEEGNVFTRAHDTVVDTIAIVTGHPIFKIFKILMIVKKVMGFLSPSKGFGMIKGFFQGLLEDPDAEPPDGDIDADGGADGDADFEGNPDNLESRMQLNAAAEHMEDPEVAEKMESMLEDPDNLDEAIENDPELKSLRDGNPLCAAMMEDPETMKILVDPDNLRALGETPDLIEMDFSNPLADEIPGGPDVPDIEVPEVDAEVPEVEMEVDAEGPEAEIDAEEEEGNLIEDVTEDFEKEDDGNEMKKGKTKKEEKKEEKGDKAEAQGWLAAAGGVVGGNIMASLGIDEMVPDLGESVQDLLGDGDGIGEMEGMEELEGEELGTGDLAEGMEEIAGAAEEIEEDGPEIEFGELEIENDGGGKDTKGKDGKKGEGEGGFGSMVSGAVGGMVMGGVMESFVGEEGMGMMEDFQEKLEEREDEMGEDGKDNKMGGNVFSAAKDYVKDTLVGDTLAAVVGDDLAENILDTQEEIENVLGGDEDEDGGNDKEVSTGDNRRRK